MSQVKKVANLKIPNSVSLPQTKVFTQERSLSIGSLPIRPKVSKVQNNFYATAVIMSYLPWTSENYFRGLPHEIYNVEAPAISSSN